MALGCLPLAMAFVAVAGATTCETDQDTFLDCDRGECVDRYTVHAADAGMCCDACCSTAVDDDTHKDVTAWTFVDSYCYCKTNVTAGTYIQKWQSGFCPTSMMKKATIGTLLVGATGAGPDSQAMIDKIHKTPGVLWTAGKTSVDAGALKILAGVKPEAMAKRAAFAKSFKKASLSSERIPERFDSETNWPNCAKVIGDIRDQSMCGCCWAFGAASAASDRLCIATNATAMVPLSAQDVCFGASYDGCQGGDIQSPWDYIQEKGAVTGGQYQGTGPFGKGLCQDFSMVHCHHHGPQGDDPYPAEGTAGCPQQTSPRHETKCDSAAQSPHDNFSKDKWSFSGSTTMATGVQDIQKAIMAGGPVETAFTVYTDFANYVSGVYHHVTGGMEGGHAVRIVGWGVDGGVKYWKVANSWNPHWGEKGHFRIKMGECGIDDQVTFSPANAEWSQGATQSNIVV